MTDREMYELLCRKAQHIKMHIEPGDMAEVAIRFGELMQTMRHGHWINAEGYHGDCVSYGKGYYRCSCCNKVSWLAMSDKYCRCCGARMDGEARESD